MGYWEGIHTKEVVVLCGGKGERLKGVSVNMPKALVKVAGRPFLDFILDDLKNQGFRRIILSVGYKRDEIRRHCIAAGHEVEFSEEETPLGTGGAVKKAVPLIRGDSFMVINGDSICPVDFSRFYEFHSKKRGIISFVLVKPKMGRDYGVIELGEDERIRSFREKSDCGENMFINGGIYCMSKEIAGHMPEEDGFSLEDDLFPRLIPLGCYGFISEADLLDIGTPERYAEAERFLAQLRHLRPGTDSGQ